MPVKPDDEGRDWDEVNIMVEVSDTHPISSSVRSRNCQDFEQIQRDNLCLELARLSSNHRSIMR